MKMNLSTMSIIAIYLIVFCGCSKDSSKEDAPKSGNIKFEDAVAKARLVQLYDLNSDGELSYSEAEAVTNLKDMNWDGIKFLDEFKYFTGITRFNFKGSKTIERFSIPKNVTTVALDGARKSESPLLKEIRLYPTIVVKSRTSDFDDYYLMLYAGMMNKESKSNYILYVNKNLVSSYKEKMLQEISTYISTNPNLSSFTMEEFEKDINQRIKGL